MQGALHFPTIAVPDSAWINKALLYWDTVGTIVPAPWWETPERLGEHTHALVKAELVRMVFPHEIAFEDAPFFHWLDGISESELQRRRQSFDLGKRRRLHWDKFIVWGPPGVMLLEERGLAENHDKGQEDQWVEIEDTTAMEFMARLALGLCHPGSQLTEQTSQDWVPATAESSALVGLLSGLVSLPNDDAPKRTLNLRVGGEVRASEIRSAVLEKALPVPDGLIPPEKLIQFRREHGSKLPDFRRELDHRIDQILEQEDAELAQRRLDRLNEELEDLRAPVEAYLAESGIRGVSNSRLLRLLKVLPLFSSWVGGIQDAAEALQSAPDMATEPLAYAAFAGAKFAPLTRYGPASQSGPLLVEPALGV